jgi:hypothetical protein
VPENNLLQAQLIDRNHLLANQDQRALTRSRTHPPPCPPLVPKVAPPSVSQCSKKISSILFPFSFASFFLLTIPLRTENMFTINHYALFSSSNALHRDKPTLWSIGPKLRVEFPIPDLAIGASLYLHNQFYKSYKSYSDANAHEIWTVYRANTLNKSNSIIRTKDEVQTIE